VTFPPFLVNQSRWSQALQHLAVTKGLDHVELLSQLTAAIVLENDRPENKYLADENLAWGQNLLAAQGAGIVGFVGLRNPTGSGKLVVTESLEGIRVTTGRIYIGLGRTVTVTQVNTEQPRDTRLQKAGQFGVGAPNIAGQIVSARSDTIVTTPFVVAERGASGGNITAQGAGLYTIPVVLAPGDTVFVWGSDGLGGTLANEAIQASFTWRERTMEPTET
jgi:hypothetical protein